MAKDSSGNKHGQQSTTNSKGVTASRNVEMVVVDGKVVPDPTDSGIKN